MLTPGQILHLNGIKESLPPLEPHDRDYVMGHAVALEASGIADDASWERTQLEKIIIQFGWRLAYCRWVEKRISGNQRREIISYEEWKNGF